MSVDALSRYMKNTSLVASSAQDWLKNKAWHEHFLTYNRPVTILHPLFKNSGQYLLVSTASGGLTTALGLSEIL